MSENLQVNDITYSYILREASEVARSGVISPDFNPDTQLIHDDEDIQHGGEDIHVGGAEFPDYIDATEAQKSQYAFICYDHAPSPPANPLSPAGFNDGSLPYSPV